MSTPIATPEDIRLFLMDRPEFNTLHGGIEFTQEMIEKAIVYTVDHFNVSAPPNSTKCTVDSFPSMYLLLMGASGRLLLSYAINNAVNQFSYSADGTSITDKDKAPVLQSLGQELWEEYKKAAMDLKIMCNVHKAAGRKGSAYRWTIT